MPTRRPHAHARPRDAHARPRPPTRRPRTPTRRPRDARPTRRGQEDACQCSAPVVWRRRSFPHARTPTRRPRTPTRRPRDAHARPRDAHARPRDAHARPRDAQRDAGRKMCAPVLCRRRCPHARTPTHAHATPHTKDDARTHCTHTTHTPHTTLSVSSGKPRCGQGSKARLLFR